MYTGRLEAGRSDRSTKDDKTQRSQKSQKSGKSAKSKSKSKTKSKKSKKGLSPPKDFDLKKMELEIQTTPKSKSKEIIEEAKPVVEVPTTPTVEDIKPASPGPQELAGAVPVQVDGAVGTAGMPGQAEAAGAVPGEALQTAEVRGSWLRKWPLLTLGLLTIELWLVIGWLSMAFINKCDPEAFKGWVVFDAVLIVASIAILAVLMILRRHVTLVEAEGGECYVIKYKYRFIFYCLHSLRCFLLISLAFVSFFKFDIGKPIFGLFGMAVGELILAATLLIFTLRKRFVLIKCKDQ